MSNVLNNVEKVQSWRKRTKERIVMAMGGKCCICGYDKCDAALDMHHLDASQKEFKISETLKNPKSWDRIAAELRKCVCLCNRCHKEVHAGITTIPANATRFNEDYAEYKKIMPMDECLICGKLKSANRYTCSYACAAKRANKVNWDSVDLAELIVTHKMSFCQIGRMLGVSDTAVGKRAKKLGISKHSGVVQLVERHAVNMVR